MRQTELIGGEILSAYSYRGGVSAGVNYVRVYFFLDWRPLLFRTLSDMGCLFPSFIPLEKIGCIEIFKL
jgi:hypothetical protein